MGFRNLFRRKARTVLTVMGVVIGTISIVLMVSIGYGLNYNFRKQVMENGAMTIISISAQEWSDDGNGNGSTVTQKVNDALVDKIKKLDHVRACTGVIEKSMQIQCGKYSAYASVRAMNRDTFKDFGFPELQLGSYPTDDNNSVLIFGQDVLSSFGFFSGSSYKQKTVTLGKDRLYFTFGDYTVPEGGKQFKYVIKDYAEFEESTNYLYQYYVYMDLDFYKDLYKKYIKTLSMNDRRAAIKKLNSYDSIQINVDSMDNVLEVQKKIESWGYKTQSDMEYVESSMKTSEMLQKVLCAIGGVSFIVAAINITNTMIMSIYERTKEIGIMKVLGCYIRDIKRLFLFEAGIIGFIGGTLGVAFSYLARLLINKYGAQFLGSIFGSSSSDGSTTTYCMIPTWLPLVAIIGAVVVGIVSGYMPAARATKISAIEAMKNEG